jgi:hypothetical protein
MLISAVSLSNYRITKRAEGILSPGGAAAWDTASSGFAVAPLDILTPLMKTSVQQYVNLERIVARPPEWTPTQKHIVLFGIASTIAFMHGNRFIHHPIPGNNKPTNEKHLQMFQGPSILSSIFHVVLRNPSK